VKKQHKAKMGRRTIGSHAAPVIALRLPDEYRQAIDIWLRKPREKPILTPSEAIRELIRVGLKEEGLHV
jgi:hypothetical protein